jgi:hypothetical protein
MVKGIEYLDEENLRVYLGTEAVSPTTYTVQEVHSLIKEELKKAPYIDRDKLTISTGNDVYDQTTGATTGVVMFMQDGWTIWVEDQVSRHKVKFTAGLVLDQAGGEPLGDPLNVNWERADQSVSNVSNLTTLESKQDSSIALLVNDSEWVSPGVVNVYDSNGKTGGVVIYQWKTYDVNDIQTHLRAPKRLERIVPPVQP